MRARWAAAVAAAAMLVVAGSAGAASATDPVGLHSGYVVDDAEVLSASEETALQNRLTLLYEDTGIDLYTVLVEEFTNPSVSEQWAAEVAYENGLGTDQYLLAISTAGRNYVIDGDLEEGPVSADDLDAIQESIRPELREGDYVGAVTLAADQFDAVLSGTSGGASDTQDNASGANSFPLTLVLLVVAAIVAIVLLIVFARRASRRTNGKGTSGANAKSLDELGKRAASALIATDDALKTSEQELGFAHAQFGDAATAEFADALIAARASLDHAFSLQQQEDDSTPDSEDTVRAWREQIYTLCTAANEALDEKAEAFDELRKLAQNAPEALARIQDQRTKLAPLVGTVAEGVQDLQQRFAADALDSIQDNPLQAQQRLAFADEQLAAAEQAIGAGNGDAAAVNIRSAEQSLAQVAMLSDAVNALGADFAAAERTAAELIRDLDNDIAAAGALPDPESKIAPILAATVAEVAAAKTNLAVTQKRPLHVAAALTSANERIDAVMRDVREANEQASRDRQMLGHALAQAQAQVSAAESYLVPRRGGVGAQARTRLAEAGACLVQAQQFQQSNPTQALQLAKRAQNLASVSLQLAQGDVGSFQGTGPGRSNEFGNAMAGAVAGQVLGAVLGGILSSGSSRSSNHRGGFGGSFGGGHSRSGGSSHRGGRRGSRF